jgi:hypothetical protein
VQSQLLLLQLQLLVWPAAAVLSCCNCWRGVLQPQALLLLLPLQRSLLLVATQALLLLRPNSVLLGATAASAAAAAAAAAAPQCQLQLPRSVLLGACVWPAVRSSHEAVQLSCCMLVQHVPAGTAVTKKQHWHQCSSV